MQTGKQKLALVAFTGARVDDDGRIIDHEGYPVTDDPAAKAQHQRTPFDEKDNHTLAGWLARAAVEGISLKGPRIFKDLELTVRWVRCRAGTVSNPSASDLTSHLAVLAEILEARLPGDHAEPRHGEDCI